jgi:hypothetical protein
MGFFWQSLYFMSLSVYIQVANFCAEDDGSFWSRWIKPDAVAHAEV